MPCPPYRQRGQGSVEFLLAAVPVLMLALAAIEATHWYFIRQAVSQALAQAARAAITQHAHPAVLDQAFTHALLPMHAAPTRAASMQRIQRNMATRETSSGLPAWRIRILSPSRASFTDFASANPDLPRHGSRAVIDTDYLHEQHLARSGRGRPDGRGPLSGQTILQANTLVLELTWLHEPLLPGVRGLLRAVAPVDTRYGSLAMARAGYLPIRRQVAMVMQSHPVEWEMPPHGRVVRSLVPNDAEPPYGAALPPDGSPGIGLPPGPGFAPGSEHAPPDTPPQDTGRPNDPPSDAATPPSAGGTDDTQRDGDLPADAGPGADGADAAVPPDDGDVCPDCCP